MCASRAKSIDENHSVKTFVSRNKVIKTSISQPHYELEPTLKH